MRNYAKYAGDPRQITARFASKCHTCGKPIKKGESIIYWPNGKHAGHLTCDEADYRNSLASFEDEERYNSQYCWSAFSGRSGSDNNRNRNGFFILVKMPSSCRKCALPIITPDPVMFLPIIICSLVFWYRLIDGLRFLQPFLEFPGPSSPLIHRFKTEHTL